MKEEENLETKGRIDSCSIATRPDGSEIKGKKKDGSDYTMYKYKIGGKFFSGFKDVEEYELKRGDYCIVTYKEAPNPRGGTPYKNIVNIVGGVSPAEVEETNEKYNVEKPGETRQLVEDKQPDIQERILKGMAYNKTVDWIIATRKLALKGLMRDSNNKLIPAKDYTLADNFDTVFDFLLKKAKEK